MTNHSSRERDYLAHMLGAVDQIQEYTCGKSKEDFLIERLLQDGVIRNFEILGEAAKKLIDAVEDAETKFPGIPFAAIYAMRNQLSHGYFSVDLEIVWNVIERDIPALRKEIVAAVAMLDGRPNSK
jgi:uncharacterized protein with HEPN domain